jgi:hypothetical protein
LGNSNCAMLALQGTDGARDAAWVERANLRMNELALEKAFYMLGCLTSQERTTIRVA